MHPAVVPNPAPCNQYNFTLTPVRPGPTVTQPHPHISSSLALSFFISPRADLHKQEHLFFLFFLPPSRPLSLLYGS